ncbi:MAG: hypothetical protein ACYCW6_00380 [Candidatus Xenobia bacterium]
MSLLIALVVATAAYADEKPGAECMMCHVAPHTVNTDGVLVPGTMPNSLAVQAADGRVLELQSDPHLLALHLAPGVAVHITGILKGTRVLLETLAVSSGGQMQTVLKNSYPTTGRCSMCGCRMTLTSAEQADSVCTMCMCGKKCSECMK